MHGVPQDLALQQFVGRTLEQIRMSEHQLQLLFDKADWIRIEGDWQLRDDKNLVLDRAMEHSERDASGIHRLLGKSVITFAIDAPTSFRLAFESGLILQIVDSSDRYESFSVGDRYI
jgi:hypothetical protein